MARNGMAPTSPHRASAARAANTIASWSAFAAEIEHSLRLLSQIRLQISLFIVRIAGQPDAAVASAVADALIRLGSVGGLADGSIGLLYLGPRAPGSGGNPALTSHVRNLIERGLQERGLATHAERIEVAATHAWTDEISGAEELSRPLFVQPARRPAGFAPAHTRFAH